MKKRWFIYSAVLLIFVSSVSLAEEYKFDVSEIEKKPYHVGGYAEFRPVLFVLDRNAALYKLRFFDRDEGKTIEEYNGKLQLEGSYEKGIARLFVRTNFDLKYSYLGWEHNETKRMIYEGYLSLKPSDSLSFKFGKQTLLWGKGYAFNPVAFITRPNFAARLYFLLYDTDIDFIGLTGGSRTSRVGMDFSKNITTNIEVHGEFAFINNQTKKVIDSQGNVSESQFDAKSYLLGIRYLTASDTTLILENYLNGTGFSRLEMKDYFSFIDKGYDQFLSRGNSSLLKKASSVTEGNYGRPNTMQDYLYLRVSQKEPFNILYFTPAITTVMNLDDNSLQLSPELLYTRFTNWELRLKGTALVGQKATEFGEKQNDYRIELRVRYYFY